MNISPEYIISKIKQAGIVGAGGAGFPTHAKLGQQVQQVIANGAECEPLLAGDVTLLENQSPRVIQGLLLTMAACGAKEGILAVKAKHSSLIKNILEQTTQSYPRIKLHLLDDFYPAGDEQTLIYEVLEKRVLPGQFPPSAGVVVNNVTTLWQVAAAFSGKAVTSRLVTVTGNVRRPVVVETPVGTPFSDLIATAGGSELDDYRIIVGGPMMGQLAGNKEDCSTKTTSGIIVISPQHWLAQRAQATSRQQLRRARSACDNCRMCTDLCPRYLLGHPIEPHATMRALAQPQNDTAQHILSAALCCLCGICDTIACPCNLSPRSLYLALKKELARQKALPCPFKARPVPEDRRQKRTSADRVKQRLDVNQFAGKRPAPATTALRPAKVRIKLRQHVGAPAVPVVEAGQRVDKGQLVGEIPPGKLGARVHASVDGVVSKIENGVVEITR